MFSRMTKTRRITQKRAMWTPIGTIASRIAARLKATREEISGLGVAEAIAVIAPGKGADAPTQIADHDAGEDARGFGNKGRTYSRQGGVTGWSGGYAGGNHVLACSVAWR